MLIQGIDSVLYTSASSNRIASSTNRGETWEIVGKLPEQDGIIGSMIESLSDVFYIGTFDWGRVFRSFDGGEEWRRVGELLREPNCQEVNCLVTVNQGITYAGTSWGAHVLKGGYISGYLVSSVYDLEAQSSFDKMSWLTDSNEQTIVMRVRTSDNPLMSGATEWENCDTVTNGQDISEVNSVHDGHRFIQYRVEMSTDDREVTPILHEVTIESQAGGVEQDEEDSHSLPRTFALFQNHPNPFNPTTTIPYQIGNRKGDRPVHTTLKVYNVLGEVVRTLVDEPQRSGRHEVIWDGRNNRGEEVISGVYLYRMTSEGVTIVRKALVMR